MEALRNLFASMGLRKKKEDKDVAEKGGEKLEEGAEAAKGAVGQEPGIVEKVTDAVSNAAASVVAAVTPQEKSAGDKAMDKVEDGADKVGKSVDDALPNPDEPETSKKAEEAGDALSGQVDKAKKAVQDGCKKAGDVSESVEEQAGSFVKNVEQKAGKLADDSENAAEKAADKSQESGHDMMSTESKDLGNASPSKEVTTTE